MTHYVMAEGLDVNLMRSDAWTHHHEVSDDELEGHFVTIEEGLTLTEPGVVQYLPVVERDRPDLIILDTKNALFVGKESQGEDYGVMIRALNMLRRAAGGCAIVLIDHSGLGDQTRVRGSNAQQGGVHTEVMVTHDEATGLHTAQMTRDKAAAGGLGTRWQWRLAGVPEVWHPEDTDPPAVCVPAEPDAHVPFLPGDKWWQDDRPVPDAVSTIRGNGRKGVVPVFRILRWINRSDGQTQADINKAIGHWPVEDRARPDESQVSRALGLLARAGVVGHPANAAGTAPITARWTLTADYAPDEDAQ
jgi:hypothetical protein